MGTRMRMPMTERQARIEAFLAAGPWARAELHPLPGDASFRRYVRLTGGPKPALLMDAPPPEDVRPFVKVDRLLSGYGLSVPDIYQADEDNGLLVIEDFGDDTYTRRLASGADEGALYRLAVDTLIALHRATGARADEDIDLPPYDFGRYWTEALLLPEWYLPAIGLPPSSAAMEEYAALWQSLLPLADALPASLVLRDYHVDNIMALDHRDGVRQCGLLDFQDALVGPVAYDLVSLLHDARRDVSPAVRQAMTDRYLTAFPDLDPAEFAAAAAILSAQRNCKIIGIFTRLLKRDGKPVYLRHIPRVWRLLERDVSHPALAPLADWLDRHVPAAHRQPPEAA